mgnify:CR=1 FL=1
MKIQWEILIAFLMFMTLMSYTAHVANADEEYHAKIKPIKQQYCFTKITTTIKDDVVTKEEKLINNNLQASISDKINSEHGFTTTDLNLSSQ